MTIYNSLIWRSDVDEVVQTLPELDELAGKSVMITGATGLICSAVVDIIMRYNDTHKLKIQVYAAGRWAEKMVIRFGDIVERDEFRYVVYDASATNNILDFHCDYIIHGASNSYPGIIVKEPVETMLSNFTGMKCLLDYAKDYGRQLLNDSILQEGR